MSSIGSVQSTAVRAFNQALQGRASSIARIATGENPARASAESTRTLGRDEVLASAASIALKIAHDQQFRALDLLA